MTNILELEQRIDALAAEMQDTRQALAEAKRARSMRVGDAGAVLDRLKAGEDIVRTRRGLRWALSGRLAQGLTPREQSALQELLAAGAVTECYRRAETS